jgi:HTH-type transcriptional regulator / antitoxin HigA
MMAAIKPIRTEADYDVTLARVDALMDAELDTPGGNELDILVPVVVLNARDRLRK